MNGDWIDGPDLQPLQRAGCRPLHFAGKIVYRGHAGLMVYDGTSARQAGPEVKGLVVDGGTLYVLSGGLVRRSTDLSTWTTVAAAPADASSLGVLDRQLYVGTADSKLYRLGGASAVRPASYSSSPCSASPRWRRAAMS